MRKIILQMMISLDGYYEGPSRELDWHHVDDEFNGYAIELLNSVDVLLFGRVTYELDGKLLDVSGGKSRRPNYRRQDEQPAQNCIFKDP